MTRSHSPSDGAPTRQDRSVHDEHPDLVLIDRRVLEPFAALAAVFDMSLDTRRPQKDAYKVAVALGDLRALSTALAAPVLVREGEENSSSRSQMSAESPTTEPSATIPSRATILAVVQAWDDGIGSLSNLTYQDIERRLTRRLGVQG
jgi:hypothetical protein